MGATKKRYTFFVGVDVSKNELDFAVIYDGNFLFHKETKNEISDISDFVKYLKALPRFTKSKAIFCMENTGIYCHHLREALRKYKIAFVLENGFRIKHSLGLARGKNDKIDAIRIANYTYRNRENLYLWIPRSKTVEQLSNLVSMRNRLLKTKVALAHPLNEQSLFLNTTTIKFTNQLCKNSLDSIKIDLLNVDKAIVVLIESDNYLKNLVNIITSIPCVGLLTAIQIIIASNEFKGINSVKKFACYAGVAPFKRESGVFKGKAKVSHLANRKMKTLLHTCALNAMRFNPELKEYYRRKTAEGKNKMTVINAIRFKILARIFTCVHQNRLYENEFISKFSLSQTTDQ